MASKEDIADVRRLVQELRKTNFDLQLRVEELETRVAALENGQVTHREPEQIFTCIQCMTEYKESRNAEGCCFYHGGSLVGHGWEYEYSCCGKKSRDYDSAKTFPGCVKGRHRSKHHSEYYYSNYKFYMQDQSKQAKEIWMEMDVQDLVTDCWEWADVGLSNSGELFIVAGESCGTHTAIAVYSCTELRNMEGENVVAFDKSDSMGWSIKAELLVDGTTATAVRVSIKPCSSTVPLVKQVAIEYNDKGMPVSSGKQPEVLSDPSPEPLEKKCYSLPGKLQEGPVIEPGVDYSKKRKNDYESEITGGCPLKLQQHGETKVDSSTRLFDGKWNNLFSCTVKVTNSKQEKVSVTDAYGEYMDADGEWIRCDQVFIGRDGFRGNYEWFDTPNFWLPEGSTASFIVRLCIRITGDPPCSHYAGRRAHSSLPQPLHLRFTFIDQNDNKASLRFEQGNQPLDLATEEKRIEEWCRKNKENLIGWTFADNKDKNQRSDAAIYFDDNGLVCYRPAVNNNAMYTYRVSTSQKKIGYEAKSNDQNEFVIDEWEHEDNDTTITPYGLVDIETAFMYGIKIIIKTPTSETVESFLLPDVVVHGELSVRPGEVIGSREVAINWNISRASCNDTIYVYPVNGKSSIADVKNSKGTTEGESFLKTPKVPGMYEARYYPASMQSQYYGYRHDQYIATARFRVMGTV